jgi:hypothetical protein
VDLWLGSRWTAHRLVFRRRDIIQQFADPPQFTGAWQLGRNIDGEKSIFGNRDRFIYVPQCVLDLQPIFTFAENGPDTGIVALYAQQVVNRAEIEVHFSRIFRLEVADFQVDDYITVQSGVVKKQIEIIVLASDLNVAGSQ